MPNYHPEDVETKWQKRWEENPANNKAVDFDKKPKHYPLAEFPYPSGSGLHMGHTFAYTIPDIYARYRRAKGFNVLFPMGWDAFGLPTENYAVKTGIQPAVATKQNTDGFRSQMKRLGLSFDWSREINTTDSNYYKWTQWIFIQLFKHGLAYKAEVPVGWCPSCKVILANEEIVGEKCERCGTPAERRMQNQWLLRITKYADRLADELDLVDFPDYIKKSQRDWIGKSEGALLKFKIKGVRHSSKESSTRPESFQMNDPGQSQDDNFIEVFTTRPDTLYGATFMVIAPEHELVAEILRHSGESATPESNKIGFWTSQNDIEEIENYIGQAKKKSELERAELSKEKTGVDTGLKAINPVNGKEIPIWISDFVLASYGTGEIMSVPAHDERDKEFAQKFGLPIVQVVDESGKLINSGDWNGLEMPKDMGKVIAWLEEKGIGKKSVTYHLRDWVFSRQHYWGEPIPLVFCENCAVNVKSQISELDSRGLKLSNVKDRPNEGELQNPGWFAIPESDLPLKLPKVDRYQPTDTGESPLANVKDWVDTKCPKCGGPAKRETDTMPNWAGSSWYYLAYLLRDKFGNSKHEARNSKQILNSNDLNSKNVSDFGFQISDFQNIFDWGKDILAYWLPVDIYFGGAEHTTLHLLYSRFWHKFLNDIGVVPGKEPYRKRYQHGVILGPDGSRMSKSRGNVVNPEDVINKFGADTLRTYLAFMGPYDAVMPWSTTGVEGVWRFLNRVWDYCHSDKMIANKTSPELARKLHMTIKKVGEDVENIKENTAVAALMEFVNSWSKLGGLSREDAIKFLQLLAPFAPHIVEELYQTLKNSKHQVPSTKQIQNSKSKNTKRFESSNFDVDNSLEFGICNLEFLPGDSIHSLPWPEYDKNLVKEETITIAIQINGKLRGELAVDAAKVPDKEFVETEAKILPSVVKHLEDKKIVKVIYVEGKIINFVLQA